MTKDMGFDYHEPPEKEAKRIGKWVSIVFDAIFPMVLIGIAYLVSRHYFGV